MRVYAVMWLGLCLFLIGLGGSIIWSSTSRLPHRYDTLARSGIRTTAQLVACAPGIGGGRGIGCRLALRYQGHRRVWDYPENSPQFNGLSDGVSVPVLVDPHNSNIVYTVRDVEQRTNTRGFALTGLIFIVPGALGLVAMGWFALRFVPRAKWRDAG
jgi:hypothetical protein